MATLLGSLLVSLGLESSSFRSGLTDAEKQMRKTQKNFERIGSNFQKVGAGLSLGITAPLAIIAGSGISAAKDFGKAMANVSTLVDTSKESIDAMGQSVIDISKRVPVQTEDLTAALYDVRSAGIGAADAMKVLEGSAKLGLAGLGSTKEATDLVTSSINAFNLKGADQAKVYDNIFRTVKAGKTTISELAQGFGSVVPVVAQSRIKLDEYLASVAALTTTGLPAAQAQTQIRAAIAGLTRDTKESSAAFEKLGVKDFKGLVEKSGGMVQAFAAIKGAVGGNDAQLLKLLGSIEGFNAVVGLTGQNGKAFTDTLGGMRDGTDALTEAVAKQAGTTVAKMQAMQNSLQASAIQIGTALAPAVGHLADMLSGLAGWFSELSPVTQKWVIGLGALAAAAGPVLIGFGSMIKIFGILLPAIGPITAGIVSISTAITTTAIPAIGSFIVAMSPILLPLAAVAGAVALVVATVNHWDDIKAVAGRVVDYMSGLYRGVKTWLVDKLGAVWDAVMKPIRVVGDAFYRLYDRVVGHSYVPDMVDEIGVQMARLDAEMVSPAKKATDAAAQAFEALQRRVAPILDRLFPDQAKTNAFAKDMQDLQDFAKGSGWSDAKTAEAIKRLRADNGDNRGALGTDAPTIGSPVSALPPESEITDLGKTISDTWDGVRAANDNVVASFAGLARDVAGSLGNFVNSIKSKDWIGALQNVLDIIGQVAGIIRGTGKPATRTFSTNMTPSTGNGLQAFGGGRAIGGPVLANTDYLVGERGPEILRMGGRGGSIVPNDKIGGAGVVRVMVQANDYFDARVQSVSGEVAVQTIGASNRTQARAQSRRLR